MARSPQPVEIFEQRPQLVERLGALRRLARLDSGDIGCGQRGGRARLMLRRRSTGGSFGALLIEDFGGVARLGRRGRGWWRLIGHAVDRRLADERIDAGVHIEGEQFARVAGIGTHARQSRRAAQSVKQLCATGSKR